MTSSTNATPPTLDQVLAGMSTTLNGTLPPSVRLAASVMPDLVLHHAQDSGYAMPKEGGALSNETRTLIYLGVALATGSDACIEAMMNKAQAQHLDEAKILETVKIARFAEATRVFGNAERVSASRSRPSGPPGALRTICSRARIPRSTNRTRADSDTQRTVSSRSASKAPGCGGRSRRHAGTGTTSTGVSLNSSTPRVTAPT